MQVAVPGPNGSLEKRELPGSAAHRAVQGLPEFRGGPGQLETGDGLAPPPGPFGFPFTPCPSGCVHSNLRGQGGLPQPHRTWISKLLFRLEGLKPKTPHF